MSDFSHALRTWRKSRRFSQLQLAVEADVSSRHISFLETGRARPSAAMVGRLGDALHLPLAARNQLLNLAGFAVRYPSREWEDAEMAAVRAAIAHMIDSHAPYPAFAADRHWTMYRLNAPASALFSTVGLREGASLLDSMLSEALPKAIENWPEVAHNAALRLRTESAAQGGNNRFDAAADVLSQVPPARRYSSGPVLPTIFRVGSVRLSLFSTIAQFGSPEDVALDDMKIEHYFPADEETDKFLRAFAENGYRPPSANP